MTTMPAIRIIDHRQLGECTLEYSWHWSRDPYEHYTVKLTGTGQCSAGKICERGLSFDSLLYRYGVDELGMGGVDPLIVQQGTRLALEQECARQLAAMANDDPVRM